jgi:mannose-1-phosphate guanylyltransferase
MRAESALAAGQWDVLCPQCGGRLEMQATPERVSNPQNAYGMSKFGEEMVAINLGRRYGIPTIDDRPLLEIWLEAFDCAGLDEVLVNLHHLPDVVQRYLSTRAGAPVIHTVFEPELLGNAGTLVANRQWVDGEDFFLACNADNLTDFDLSSLIDAQRKRTPLATLTVFHSDSPSSGGVVDLDETGTVTGFVEKPAESVSDLVNAGMYAFQPKALDEIGGVPPCDIDFDLLPHLVGRARAVLVDGYFRDIGTVQSYHQARREWPARVSR